MGALLEKPVLDKFTVDGQFHGPDFHVAYGGAMLQGWRPYMEDAISVHCIAPDAKAAAEVKATAAAAPQEDPLRATLQRFLVFSLFDGHGVRALAPHIASLLTDRRAQCPLTDCLMSLVLCRAKRPRGTVRSVSTRFC
jgi:hypothetical protein